MYFAIHKELILSTIKIFIHVLDINPASLYNKKPPTHSIKNSVSR